MRVQGEVKKKRGKGKKKEANKRTENEAIYEMICAWKIRVEQRGNETGILIVISMGPYDYEGV